MPDATKTSPPSIDVRHAIENDHRGAFVIERGDERLAEMSYTMGGPTLLIVDHTKVDDSLRGQGVGRRLLDALVAHARAHHLAVLPLCPYARSVFDKDPSIGDVLSK